MCVEAPFFEDDKQKTLNKDDSSSKSLIDLYSELHLAILHTLQAVPTLKKPMTQSQVSSIYLLYDI